MNKSANSLFYADAQSGALTSVGDFFAMAASAGHCTPICKPASTLQAFSCLVHSMVADVPITLIDGDLSQSEVSGLIGDNSVPARSPRADFCAAMRAYCDGNLINFIPWKKWRLRLFTSGTTGRPKSVEHSFETLFGGLRVSPKHAPDVWAYAFNPTHFAGVCAFAQALFNSNIIVDVFSAEREKIARAFEKFSITHISATPTFYRMLCLGKKFTAPTLRSITSGGETFDESTMNKLSALFPNAKVKNIYASTECGQALCSDGAVFSIDAARTRINGGELLLKAGNPPMWVSTGDLVEIVGENPTRIKFIGRKGEMINVGGYKVNPAEVEEALRGIEHVLDARAFPIKNSVAGNIVGAEVVVDSEISERQIRAALTQKLQGFKIPRVIKFVNSIQKTRTGKVKRWAIIL